MQPAFLGFAILCAIFIEIAGFIVVGSRIGVLPTLALVVIFMFAGTRILRIRGVGILKRIQREINAGKAPDRAMADGAMIVTGAILLIIPGFVSDIIGVLLLVRPVRDVLWRHMSKRIFHARAYTKTRPMQTKTIDLDNSDYHSADPENSPWRKPWDNGRKE